MTATRCEPAVHPERVKVRNWPIPDLPIHARAISWMYRKISAGIRLIHRFYINFYAQKGPLEPGLAG